MKMKMKLENGWLYIIETSNREDMAFKRWGGLIKWNGRARRWEGKECAELLNKLCDMLKRENKTPPSAIERQRCRLNTLRHLVDEERVKPADDLKPIADIPVKTKLFAHQMRAFNMCLLTFGMAEPIDGELKSEAERNA